MKRALAGTVDAILVATDFSDTAEAGVDWAMEIARVHGARLHLLHALLLPNRTTDFLPSPPDLSEELQAAASARLDETTARVREGGLEASSELRLGLPSESILAAAAESEVDLVVVGTRGLTGLRHLLLGSTAERVVQRAPCPVLTVHPGDADQQRRVRRILVPTDFSADAAPAVGAAQTLLSELPEPAEIILLHAYHLPYEYTVYGTIPTSLSYREDVGGLAEARLVEVAAELGRDGLTVEYAAVEGYPPEVIVREAEAREVDLIAMGTHGRSGLAHLLLGSTAERVVQHAPCPVLTVRGEREE